MRALMLATLVVVFAACLVVAAGASNCHVDADGGGNTSAAGQCTPGEAEGELACDQKTQPCAICGEPIGPKPVRLEAEGTYLYDCIFCALVGVEGRGDVSLTAAGESSGKAITLTRRGGTWKASPSSAVALALPSPADDCGGRRLVFATADEFAAYVKGQPELVKEKPKAIPLAKVDQIIEAVRPPLPKEAVCPVAKRTITPDRNTEWTIANGTVYYFCCAGCKSRFGQ